MVHYVGKLSEMRHSHISLVPVVYLKSYIFLLNNDDDG